MKKVICLFALAVLLSGCTKPTVTNDGKLKLSIPFDFPQPKTDTKQ